MSDIKFPNLRALPRTVDAIVRMNFDRLRNYYEALRVEETVQSSADDTHHAGLRNNPHQTHHSQLVNVFGADPTSSDTSKVKHVSNAQTKVWQDHTELVNEHIDWTDATENFKTTGTADTGVLSVTGTATATGKVKGATGHFGGATHYSEFEADGTLKYNGDAVVWDELPPIPIISLKPSGAGADPALATFLGNTKQYIFNINDEVQGGIEFIHSYQEGAGIFPHVHFVTNGLEGVDKDVQFELEYTISNAGTTFTDSFPATTTIVTGDITIPANTTDRTHVFIDFPSISGTGLEIDAYIIFRFRRIALTGGGSNPAAHPFAIAMGFHVEQDTTGSREEHTK